MTLQVPRLYNVAVAIVISCLALGTAKADDCWYECETQLYNIQESNPYIGQPELIEHHIWLRDAYQYEFSMWYADLLSYVGWLEDQIDLIDLYFQNVHSGTFQGFLTTCSMVPCPPSLEADLDYYASMVTDWLVVQSYYECQTSFWYDHWLEEFNVVSNWYN